MSIGGNIIGAIQQHCTVKNSIGESVKTWPDVHTLTGWLGLQSGESRYANYNAKVEESTHVFMCDYDSMVDILPVENTRMIIKNKVYDIMLIDNPDEMDKQLEIYLKLVGGHNGSSKV